MLFRVKEIYYFQGAKYYFEGIEKKMFWEEQAIADRLEFEVNSDLREQSNSL